MFPEELMQALERQKRPSQAKKRPKDCCQEMGNNQPAHPPRRFSPELKRPWRPVAWSKNDEILHDVKEFKPSSEVLRIVLYGPTGAGKSSFINSVQRILLGRNAMSALENSTFTGASFTKKMKIHKLKKGRGEHYPLEIVDIMGLQHSGGITADDIISVLKGHVPDKYTFNPVSSITAEKPEYKKNPTLYDKVHCLVSILSADSVSRMEDGVFVKMAEVRAAASEQGIPQVIVMTKVDKACEQVNQDLKKVYTSKKIKEKMDLCSINSGISKNAIYPVKNYAEEITKDDGIETLILTALRDILNFANDYVERELEEEA
ncbi:interferon-induced protein 44-like isoform X2 [Ictalurus punctatus]|uniref:Interferon-induced protein 44-like isoform X2 n=1 Tax=Ictalurus punctatus TaxID=7998 RepID=A0A9F7R8S5_ICTPU|nr:interferon-induced protein 44-like isoform X2 [Ictalurus punctatus]